MIYPILLWLLLNSIATYTYAQSDISKCTEQVFDREFEQYIIHNETLDKEPESLQVKPWPGSYYVKKVGSTLFVKMLVLHKILSDWWHDRDEN